MKVIINNSEIIIERQDEGTRFLLNGKIFEADVARVKNNLFHVLQNNKSFTAQVLEVNTEEKILVIKVNRNKYHVALKDTYDELLHALGMDVSLATKINNLKAPMPGLVIDVLVSERQEVKKGESLVVLEAMKMENILKAASDGQVKRVLINKGARVEKNELMIEFE